MACYDSYYPRYKEDCYWYGEWPDMGARIPYCKCKKEPAEIGPKDCENCAEYHDKYKRTNADRIRSMTDEGLAEWIKCLIIDESLRRCDTRGVWTKAEIAGGEIVPWLDWLKQEVPDDSN